VIVGGVVSKAQPIMAVIWGGLSGTYQTLPAVLMKPPPNHSDAEAREHPLVKDHGWTLSIKEENDEYRLYDAVPRKQEKYFCPDCKSKASPKDRISTKPYVDLKRWGRRVELRVRRGRFDCHNPNCKTKRFREELPELNKRHLTRDLATEVIALLFKSHKTYAFIADLYHVDEQVLRNVEKDHVAEQDLLRRKHYTLRMPHQIGIHSTRIAKKDCCLLLDFTRVNLLEIVPTQNPHDLVHTIEQLFDKRKFNNVSLTAMSVNAGYRNVVRLLFPKAQIIVPRFEVEALANHNFTKLLQRAGRRTGLNKKQRESVRNILRRSPRRLSKQERLDFEKVLHESALLRSAYENKERLIEILRSPTKESGLKRYKEWSETLAGSFEIELLRDLDGWTDAIFEGLSYPHNNYVVQFERLIERLQTTGHYSFETVRGRLLYSSGFQSQREPEMDTRHLFDESCGENEDLGVPIEILIQQFERMFPE
jgi:transposase